MTTKDFINKSKTIHGEIFTYEKTKYVDKTTKLIVTCEKHGDILQSPRNHYRARGCPKCSRDTLNKAIGEKYKKDFIPIANKLHNNKYDYSLVEYINYKKHVIIKCPVHGNFKQSPNVHLKGHGCKKCANELICLNKIEKYKEKFIQSANEIHNNKYDYSNVKYIKAKDEVIIICPVHGKFNQRAFCHIKGQGCPKCGDIARQNKRELLKTSINEFIRKAKETHGDKYDYSKSIYISARKNIKIICKTHGEFYQNSRNHWAGTGCPKCQLKGYSDTEWEILGDKSRYFENFSLYIIECWSENERFIKIGKTFTNINKRFVGKNNMPYKWKLLYTENGSAKYISKLEREYHFNCINNIYIPKLPFNGYTECFDISVKRIIKISTQEEEQ